MKVCVADECDNEFEPVTNKIFCSVKCRQKYHNNINYRPSTKRARQLRIELLDMLGGCCGRCGYKKNYAALVFHHINPNEKLFNVDTASTGCRSKEALVDEVKKCELVCTNCHAEIHYPDADARLV